MEDFSLDDIGDELEKVYDSVKTGGKNVFCRKGDFWTGTFSVRSFEGKLCLNETVAALAEYVCTNPEVGGFSSSHCNAEAVKVLDGKDPKTVIEDSLKAGVSDVLKSLIGLLL